MAFNSETFTFGRILLNGKKKREQRGGKKRGGKLRSKSFEYSGIVDTKTVMHLFNAMIAAVSSVYSNFDLR